MPALSSHFKDYFSGHADRYAAHRPAYPDELFKFLARTCAGHTLAWDCATGNGQAAVSLGRYFRNVIASDASEQQLASARITDGVEYRVAPAEHSGLDAGTVDLVTVAQALHWFDIEAFFAEADRVLKAGGVIAFWCYHHARVNDAIDVVYEQVYAEVGTYWPPERHIVEQRYRDIGMPFTKLPAPAFVMQAKWSADDMLAYFRTWSASQQYLAATGDDPTLAYADGLRSLWGSGRRRVTWPITLRVGRK